MYNILYWTIIVSQNRMCDNHMFAFLQRSSSVGRTSPVIVPPRQTSVTGSGHR